MDARTRIVIVGGAPIEDYEALRQELTDGDYMVYCDCGLKHEKKLGRPADLIIGDFDSEDNPLRETETIILPHVKDDTDTMFAVKEGIRRGFRRFLLLGVVGARMDHSLGNIAALEYLENRGCQGRILDDYSDLQLVTQEHSGEVPDHFSYFSLLNLYGEAGGIRVKDAYYELEDAVLTTEYPLGVSNEPLPGKTARISLTNGKLLLIRDRV